MGCVVYIDILYLNIFKNNVKAVIQATLKLYQF
jgi:hypothetical protein